MPALAPSKQTTRLQRAPCRGGGSVSDPTVAGGPAKIIRLARRLSEPADFYQGRVNTEAALPDNILVFHRQRPDQLNKHSDAKAFHQRHVLIVPLRGTGQVIANARAIPLDPGHCALIAPYQFHHYIAISRADIDWLFITFTYGRHPPAMSTTSAFSVEPPFWADLAELIRSFQLQTAGRSSDRLAWRLALLLDSLAVATSAPEGAAPIPKEKLLLLVSRLTSEHLGDPLSVRQLAQKVGLSPSHLRQRFQQIAGISVGRFQREYRLRHAAELLTTGQFNVTEASAACGWDTPYAFSRAFRSYWGHPPKVFALSRRR